MSFHGTALVWVLCCPVAAQDLFEKDNYFLAKDGLAMQMVNQNAANLTAQAAVASSESYYITITPLNSKLCVDLPGGGAYNGNQLWLWECNGAGSQIWVWQDYQLRYGADERFCIDAGDQSDGTQLFLWECNDQGQQKWAYDDDLSRLYIDGSATCWDMYDEDSQDNGQKMHVWQCFDGQTNQQWHYWDSVAPRFVFPDSHCAYDVGSADWPRFESQSDLENDPVWSQYFNRIYGDVPYWGYPICTGSFQFLWHLAADEAQIASNPMQCKDEANPFGQELWDGQYFTRQSGVEAISVFAFIYNSKYWGASVPQNNWVEVSHTVFAGDKGAIWYYMAVGSGVWINVGKTAVYEDHPSLVWDLLQTDCHDSVQDTGPSPTECEDDFQAVYDAAISVGLDTIQITQHHDCLCGPIGTSSYMYNRRCPTEIIFLDDPNGAALACNSYLKGGWEAANDCNCDESFNSEREQMGDLDTAPLIVGYANCGAF